MKGYIMKPAFRAWLYGIGIAASGVAIVYGIASTEQIAAWVGLLSAILGITAISNVGDRGVER